MDAKLESPGKAKVLYLEQLINLKPKNYLKEEIET